MHRRYRVNCNKYCSTELPKPEVFVQFSYFTLSTQILKHKPKQSFIKISLPISSLPGEESKLQVLRSTPSCTLPPALQRSGRPSKIQLIFILLQLLVKIEAFLTNTPLCNFNVPLVLPVLKHLIKTRSSGGLEKRTDTTQIPLLNKHRTRNVSWSSLPLT